MNPEDREKENWQDVPLEVPSSKKIRSEGEAAIQPHGVLLVARQSDLRLIFVSANAERVTRIPAKDMLGKSLLECLSAEICSKIVHYDHRNHLVLEVGRRQSVVSGVGMRHHFEVVQHQGLIYIEMELEIVDPELDRLPVWAQLVMERLRTAGSMDELLKATTDSVRELTSYTRVMVYRFLEDGHGQVVAESRAKGLPPFRDLHFPVSDFPMEARARYLQQRVRLVANTQYEPVPLLIDPQLGPEERALDMTFCGLRSGSPVQLEYVRKMGAGAVLTFSLIVDDELWGLLICHHSSPRLPSPELRSTCELLSQIVSSYIRQRRDAGKQAQVEARETAMRHITRSFSEHESVVDALLAAQEHVLKLVGASGALLHLNGESHCIGFAPSPGNADAILKEMRAIVGDELYFTESLAEVIPEADKLANGVAGAMMLPTMGENFDGILWFRPEMQYEVQWGGKEGKTAVVDPRTGMVYPKKQLGKWKTLVVGCSQEWQKVDTDAAMSLGQLVNNRILRNSRGKAEDSVMVDSLTMLPNLRSFEARLKAWSRNPEEGAASVLLISIERYNLLSAAFGPMIGDDLVLQVGRRVSDLMANEEFVFARLGVDEFALLCVGCSDSEAQAHLERISKALQEPFDVQGRPFRVTTCLGMSYSSVHEAERLLREAQTALQFARMHDQRTAFFSRHLQKQVLDRVELEQDLYNALASNQFFVMYQPIVSLPEMRLLGFEALLRWNHPSRGILGPVHFIEMAEEEGLMASIGSWVLQTALQQLKIWSTECALPLKMHVNVSAEQIKTGQFVQQVEDLLQNLQLDPASVAIEVTETALLGEEAVGTLRELRAAGVGVAVDDFGTGYSSLSILRKLPLDTVKIDKAFVQPIAADATARDFVEGILNLTRTLGLNVIAEGVETEMQGKILTELGCPAAQGYFYSIPLTQDETTQLIERCRQEKWQMHPAGTFSHAA